MNMHVLPVHKQYIKYSSVLLAFYDSSMVKHREVRAVSFSKMKMNIVIFITTVNLFPDACITHHSAFEVFGYGSQVFYECYVATDKRFHDFEYDGVLYRHIERKPNMEVVQQGKIRVTSMEQTVVDSIRDFEKIAGIEEVIRCMMLVPGLNEQKVLECLARNNNGFLYQKCGYFFEEMQEEFHFSAKFFETCENGSSDAKRYLMKESQDNVFHKRWKLYAPVSLKGLIDKGVDAYDAMG